MKVLVGCEKSGIIRDAFLAAGHDAISLDLEPSRKPGPHLQCDIFEHLRSVPDKFYNLIIVHPECTTLTISGNSTYSQFSDRYGERLQQIEWVTDLWLLCIEKADKVCLENPVGVLTTMSILPDPQYVQPYNFNEDASKKTGLFLYNLPELEETGYFEPRIVEWRGKMWKRWSNQGASGSNKLGRSKKRKELRSNTYPGIARAMVDQWGNNEVRKYTLNQICGGCDFKFGVVYQNVTVSDLTQPNRRCCMCDKVVMYFYHDESESAVEANSDEEVTYFYEQGLREINYHQFWSVNTGLGL